MWQNDLDQIRAVMNQESGRILEEAMGLCQDNKYYQALCLVILEASKMHELYTQAEARLSRLGRL